MDPLGGASLPLWEPIAETYGLDLTVVNKEVDPTFPFCALRQRRLNPHGLFLALCHESPAGDTRRL